jgi:hypothetical protein
VQQVGWQQVGWQQPGLTTMAPAGAILAALGVISFFGSGTLSGGSTICSLGF